MNTFLKDKFANFCSHCCKSRVNHARQLSYTRLTLVNKIMVHGSLSWQLQVLETNSEAFFPRKVQSGSGRRTTFHTKHTHTRVSGHVKIFLTWLSVYWCHRWRTSEQLFGSLASRHGNICPENRNSVYNLHGQMKANVFQNRVFSRSDASPPHCSSQNHGDSQCCPEHNQKMDFYSLRA